MTNERYCLIDGEYRLIYTEFIVYSQSTLVRIVYMIES